MTWELVMAGGELFGMVLSAEKLWVRSQSAAL